MYGTVETNADVGAGFTREKNDVSNATFHPYILGAVFLFLLSHGKSVILSFL